MALIADGPGPRASTGGLLAARLTEGPARERGQPLTLTALAAGMHWFDESGNAIVVQVNESECSTTPGLLTTLERDYRPSAANGAGAATSESLGHP